MATITDDEALLRSNNEALRRRIRSELTALVDPASASGEVFDLYSAGGWGSKLGTLRAKRKVRIETCLERTWRSAPPHFWVGLAGKEQDFRAVLKAAERAGYGPVIELHDDDTQPLVGGTWSFKREAPRPVGWSPVAECYKDECYLGLYNLAGDESRFQQAAYRFIASVAREVSGDEAEAAIASDKQTDREALIKARIGQGAYRRNVFRYESACRITGVTDPTLLRASHMKPWALCDSSEERLDGANGLLLTPTYDVMFDRGYLTFTDDLQPMLSSSIQRDQLDRLSIPERLAVQTPLTERQKRYLAYHRRYIFDGNGWPRGGRQRTHPVVGVKRFL